jgi:hypothetical protein
MGRRLASIEEARIKAYLPNGCMMRGGLQLKLQFLQEMI